MKRLVVFLFLVSSLYVFAEPNPTTVRADRKEMVATNTLRRVHVFVSGKVQNVGFRNFVRAKARSLKLTGWVKNLPDKRVELVAEGPSAKIDELLKAVAKGPSVAKVTNVESVDEPYSGEFREFEKILGNDD